jgi:antimicrobial peptide system SdpA family protein
MKRNIKLVSFTFIVCGIWLVFIVYITIAFLPFNPLSTGKTMKSKLLNFVPQGWAFFTKNPRLPQTFIYQKKGSTLECLTDGNGGMNVFFGADRTLRYKNGLEVSYLLKKVDNSCWTECKIDLLKFVNSNDLITVNIDNDLDCKSLIGEFYVQKIEPIPWAWSRSESSIIMPSTVIKINILPK